MFPVTAGLLIILVFWINFQVKHRAFPNELTPEKLAERERLANRTPAKDISALPYITVPTETFALSGHACEDITFQKHAVSLSDLTKQKESIPFAERLRIPSPEEQEAEEYDELSYRLYQLSEKKILNLRGMSNTDIKLTYGAPNFPFLSECDANYSLLLHTLFRLGKYFYHAGRSEDAVAVLSFAVRCDTDISANYTLLAKIYKEQNKANCISELIERAKLLDSLTKEKLVRELTDMIRA